MQNLEDIPQEFTPEWRSILWHEYNAGDGSFLLQLRCGPGWDREAYNRLFVAMINCCKDHENQKSIERWIAELFWYLDFYPRFAMEGTASYTGYHDNAITNFNHLAHWLFTGEARTDDQFEPI